MAAETPDVSGRAAEIEFFERQVRPLLVDHCFECHSGAEPKAGLRLDRRDGVLTGGDSGPAAVERQPAQSLLLEAVRYESYEMPPSGKLSEEKIAILERWIALGLPWGVDAGAEEPGPSVKEFDLAERRESHWAWQPIRNPSPPSVREETWVRQSLDRFVLAKLESAGLSPAEAADPRSLVRRLSFDLIGLPPTPAQVRTFTADPSDAAWDRLVDELLASPHFGERWGRHWLDLVRYAESRGHEMDNDAPNAFQYRDYVIRALNADVPYQQFIREHIAGDLLPAPRLHPQHGFNESILGTGFWHLGEWVHSPVDTRKDEAERFDNMIDVMSKAFLGLTVACARCHDHKYDAISTRDYYSLTGFLQSSDYRQVRFESLEHNRRVADKVAAFDRQAQQKIRSRLVSEIEPLWPEIERYWMAAGRALQSPNREPKRIAEVAKEFDVESSRLQQWVDSLQQSPDVAALHLATCQTSAVVEGPLDASPRPSRLIIDYALSRPDQFIQDGFAFGSGPVRPGDFVLESIDGAGSLRVATYGAARSDPIWSGLVNVEPQVTNQRNALKAVERSGRTLRSPTFELTTGKVSCEVRGGGTAVACVDSHRFVHGPLHHETIRPLDQSDAVRWIEWDLSRYVGHRLHLEFSPKPGGSLEVLRIVDGDPVTNGSPAGPGCEIRPADLKALLLRTDEDVSRHPRARDVAAALNWLVNHLDLIAHDNGTLQARIQTEVEEMLGRRQQLAEEIQRRSHTAMAMLDGTGEDGVVFIRGNPSNPGLVVPRRFLEAIDGPEPLPISAGSGRLELADRLVSPANPFPARVMVNRIWHHLLGRGIVPTVDDFGVLGQPPTHPDLLDHLATHFIDNGWSIKQSIREIVRSSTYRLSSRPGREEIQQDPTNELWHYIPPKRLEAEVLRDTMLALSGRLDATMFGEPVPVHLTPFMTGRGRPETSGPRDGDGRRSLYVAVRRNFLPPFMLAFDMPVPFSTMGRRNVSNVPAQALILMNDPFVAEQAAGWARRALTEFPLDVQQRIAWLYESGFGRPPEPAELEAATAFLEGRAAEERTTLDDPLLWADYAHVLMNSKEFMFLR